MTCPKHPKYKAIRKPRVDCIPCWKMYHIARHLRNLREFEAKLERGDIDMPGVGMLLITVRQRIAEVEAEIGA